MAVYLHNMKMPEEPTPITIYPDGRWMDFTDGRYGMLTEILPHGDLIERDALLKKCEWVCTDDDVDVRAVRNSIIKNTPIIIPASKESE